MVSPSTAKYDTEIGNHKSTTYLLRPLYYVRSGYLNINFGYLQSLGSHGYNWSSSGATLANTTAADAYDLYFTIGNVGTSGGPGHRYYAFSLHCPTCLFYPLYYVRSGYIGIDHGRLKNTGISGHTWSGFANTLTSSIEAVAYYLAFNASGVTPSGGPTDRWVSFPFHWLSQLIQLRG